MARPGDPEPQAQHQRIVDRRVRRRIQDILDIGLDRDALYDLVAIGQFEDRLAAIQPWRIDRIAGAVVAGQCAIARAQ